MPGEPQQEIRAPLDREPLAPAWHTAALIALICAVAITGAWMTSHASQTSAAPIATDPHARIVSAYLPTIVVQWSLVLYVSRIGRPRSALGSLVGARWRTLRDAGTDLSLGLLGWLLVLALELGWARALGPSASASMVTILPRSPLELGVWVLVAASAGFCEEVVYRGYLQRQLTAFTGRAGVAIALQAVLFGIAHADQGLRGAVRVALYGLAFGALAWRRRSLLPGVACHVWTDVASGLLFR